MNMIWKDNSLYVGYFLAIREIKRTSQWTTALIVFVLTLTFFNMNLVGGVLLGIAHGVIGSYRQYYSADIVISPAANKNDLENTDSIIAVAKSLPTFKSLTVRYTEPALIEYGYQKKLKPTDLAESADGTLTGIDPQAENSVTNLSKAIVAGSYLTPSDVDEVLIGASLIKKYASLRGSVTTLGAKILKTPDVGDKIRLTVNGVQKEVFIKGVVSTNGTNIDTHIFMNETAMRELIGNNNLNSGEIAIRLIPDASDTQAKSYLETNLHNDNAMLIQTAADALPGGVTDVINTFTILGNIVGSIALIVGAVTIFIVIFVNAVTRRKYIGILKGIGISARAIEFSYVLQALFYSLSGVIIASILIYWFFVPYFALHPISYPIAKGSLAITANDLLVHGTLLIVVSIFSGFIPAWLVTRQNILDAILGR